jgi:hypothetical protein
MKTCKQILLIHPESFTVTWKTIQISFLFYILYCGDEYHYIFECTNLSEKRTSLLPKHLIERPNIIK